MIGESFENEINIKIGYMGWAVYYTCPGLTYHANKYYHSPKSIPCRSSIEFINIFLQQDFSNINKFIEFTQNFGLNCLCFEGSEYKIYLDKNYTADEYNDIINSLFELCRYDLTRFQNEIKAVLKYCANDNDNLLKELNLMQRFYIGTHKLEIPQLSEYNGGIGLYFDYDDVFPKFDEEDKFKVVDHLDIENLEFCIGEVYHTYDIRTAIHLMLFKTLSSNIKYKICKICKLPFIPQTRSDASHCELCKKASYHTKLQGEEHMYKRLYNKAYKTRHARLQKIRKAQNIKEETKKQNVANAEKTLEAWVLKAKTLLKKVELSDGDKKAFIDFIEKED